MSTTKNRSLSHFGDLVICGEVGKLEIMKILLVAPPRKLWPYMNEQDNFLMPQGLACIAAVLREGGFDVRVIDCMPEKMGWTKLREEIRTYGPQIVAAGENHATYASEVIKLVRMVKDTLPEAVTVLGGAHFTNMGEMYLKDAPIDFIVRGEGEITMLRLAEAIAGGNPAAPYDVDGISYLRDGEMFYTKPRDLVEDLNSLPIPAYDLMPMSRYGNAKYLFSSGGTTIHHSRGCPARCKFCIWWTQDANRKVVIDEKTGCRQELLSPRWRSKSVERTLEEVEILRYKHQKRCLIFTDPTFNVDPKWSAAFADEMVRRKIDVDMFAFMRADFILRDEKNGVMEKLVRSGLAHLCIGVERAENAQLGDWRKPFYNCDQTVETFELLRKKYPKVFRQATFIVGGRDETLESMALQLKFAKSLKPDYPAFHPLTPFPGTGTYDEAVKNDWLEIKDFDYYDLATPVMRSETLTREQIQAEIVRLNKSFVSVFWLVAGLLSPYRYRRNMFIWWFLISAKIFLTSLVGFKNPFTGTRYTDLRKPDWYD